MKTILTVFLSLFLTVSLLGQVDGPNSPSTSSSSGAGTTWADIDHIYTDDTDRS